MVKFIRYTLATLFFAASLGCLALWWRSYSRWDVAHGGGFNAARLFVLQSYGGMCEIGSYSDPYAGAGEWQIKSPRWEGATDPDRPLDVQDHFGLVAIGVPAAGEGGRGYYFPHWYAALIFALAGVGALRFRRQFSIRSTLVIVAIVAALLGVAVTL